MLVNSTHRARVKTKQQLHLWTGVLAVIIICFWYYVFPQHLSVDSGCDGEERRCGSIDDDSETLQILNEVWQTMFVHIHYIFSFPQETEGEKIVASVSILDAYMFQLKTKKAFALCNGSLHAFVLQDFSEETLCLKVSVPSITTV